MASGTAGWVRMDGMGPLGERLRRQRQQYRVSSGSAIVAVSRAPADKAQGGNSSLNKRQWQEEAYRMRRAPAPLPLGETRLDARSRSGGIRRRRCRRARSAAEADTSASPSNAKLAPGR